MDSAPQDKKLFSPAVNTVRTIDSTTRKNESTTIPSPRSGVVKSGSKVVDQMGWVIFPSNIWIQRWDAVILSLLLYISFTIPYQIGVSAGYHLFTNTPWFVINVIINAFFFVDTFVYFFRAYENRNGRLVFNLQRIRKKYLRTYCIPNLLSILPTNMVLYFYVNKYGFSDSNDLIVLKIFDMFKLARFARARAIMKNSDVVTNIKQSYKSVYQQFIKYSFLIVVLSHWFACTWSFVAFIEAKGAFGMEQICDPDEQGICQAKNWVANWYNGNYVDGGLNPLGWERDVDRYVLSLFWAVQTITSIGYGNVAPLTVAEWFVGCFLMLMAGIVWSYVIGGLVGVTAAMEVRGEANRKRVDDANDLIDDFLEPDEAYEKAEHSWHPDKKSMAKRIKKYIHNQKNLSPNTMCGTTLQECYPVLETLTPELERISSLLVMSKYLEVVPYLSSKCLSFEEQSLVAMGCIFMEFSAGERIKLEDSVKNFGRGIFVVESGSALAFRFSEKGKTLKRSTLLTVNMSFGDDMVLVEDGHSATKGRLNFLTFAKIIFIPRDVVLACLERNPQAWKDFGRWKYIGALLRELA